MTIRYRVSMENPAAHFFHLECHADSLKQGMLRAVMPVWAPGSYLVREFSRNVSNFEALVNGKPLQVRKVSKNLWEIDAGGEKNVKVSYDVYAFETLTSTSYLDEDRAIINGASVFCYFEGLEQNPIEVEVVPYSRFKKISTGLQEKGKNVFKAENYDALIDSPIQVGNHSIYSFVIDGRKHDIAIYGKGNIDPKKFVNDVKQMVEAAGTVFGEYPYSKYVFLVQLLSEKVGGLEHRNSTVIRMQRWGFKPRSEYLKQLTLVAHEFFHLWNVKRLKPIQFGQLNYTKECYTPLLWVAEGITSYYENEILRRAKICTIEEFLEALLDDIETLEGTVGRSIQSLEEASFDSWIKYYRQDENFPNSSVSYYTKGAVVGWMLDMEIRRNTGHEKSLDDVLRLLYRETYEKGDGFTSEEFQRACQKVSGSDMSEFFDDYVRGTKDIGYNTWFGLAGLQLTPAENNDAGFLGIRVRSQEGRLLVANVMRGSAAQKGGLYANDEIIAFNGFRVSEKSVRERIAEVEPRTNVEIVLGRDEAVLSTNVKIGRHPKLQFKLERIEKAAKEQKQFFEKWLQHEWKKELKFTAKREIPQERRWI